MAFAEGSYKPLSFDDVCRKDIYSPLNIDWHTTWLNITLSQSQKLKTLDDKLDDKL